MRFDGVVLYGPPASGKDTVTAEMCRLSDAYTHFEKLKTGNGRTRGYRLVSDQRLADLRKRGMIVHEVARYGATYAVDSLHLDKLREDRRVPVVHMGQVAGIHALQQYSASWLDVLLWCSKDVAEERLRHRGSTDIDERMAVWHATLADLRSLTEPRITLSVRTDSIAPAVTAAVIHAAMMGDSPGRDFLSAGAAIHS